MNETMLRGYSGLVVPVHAEKSHWFIMTWEKGSDTIYIRDSLKVIMNC